MSKHTKSQPAGDALDELTQQLLECGGVLSQIISHMVECEAAGHSAPDAAPIPEVAYGLIRDVINGLAKKHTEADIRTAAVIVAEATEVIGEDVFFVPFDGSLAELN